MDQGIIKYYRWLFSARGVFSLFPFRAEEWTMLLLSLNDIVIVLPQMYVAVRVQRKERADPHAPANKES